MKKRRKETEGETPPNHLINLDLGEETHLAAPLGRIYWQECAGKKKNNNFRREAANRPGGAVSLKEERSRRTGGQICAGPGAEPRGGSNSTEDGRDKKGNVAVFAQGEEMSVTRGKLGPVFGINPTAEKRPGGNGGAEKVSSLEPTQTERQARSVEVQ